MLRAHFLDTELHQFSRSERDAVDEICALTEPQLRERLPTLAPYVHLLVEPGSTVIPETGEVGFTMAAHSIRWTVDPERDIAQTAREHLRAVLFHEAHHATRLVHFPQEAYAVDWPSAAIFEGLATLFEAEARGALPPWGEYDLDVIAEWADELFAQPIDDTFAQWKFTHPDGRRWIAYRVGTYLAQRVTDVLGRDAAALASEPMHELVAAAGASSRH